ncbi:hypothetical protein [Microbacterium sp.]|jgi:hypothetical protein|uniref:hypothetical protein n=1 Tax=Microbacterium sp. TaxID=51671 RepID=UPI0037C975FD
MSTLGVLVAALVTLSACTFGSPATDDGSPATDDGSPAPPPYVSSPEDDAVADAIREEITERMDE